MSKKKVIAVYADSPTVPTGFGQVIKNIFMPLVKSGRYEIKQFGINYSGYPHDFPWKIWPANNPLLCVGRAGDPYGREHLKQWLEEQSYDMLFMLNDAWILREFVPPLLEPLKKAGKPVVAYFPIDCDEYDPQWYSWLKEVTLSVTYTEYGKKIVQDLCPDLNVKVIPHGADVTTHHPIRDDNERVVELRKRMNSDFVFLNVNVNQPRKNIPASLMAMKKYIELSGNQNDKLVLHMKEADNFGYHLPILTKNVFGDREGNQRVVLISSQKIPDKDMNLLYVSSDCVISTTHGEGWGLSLSESLCTETPIIAPAHTSIPEVAAGYGRLVNPGLKHCALPFQNDRSIWRYFVDPQDMAEAMVEVRTKYDVWKDQARKARKWYVENRQWGKHIVPQWDNLFKELMNGVKDDEKKQPSPIVPPENS